MALLIIGSDRENEFYSFTKEFAAGRDVRKWPDSGNASDIRYALAWQAKPGELAKFENLELIVSVGAGVDHLFKDPDLPDVPIVRYVDPDLTGRMVQYVVLHTLFHVRRMTEFIELQRARTWDYRLEPMSTEVRVGILGFGHLGQAVGRALGALGYQIRGWSRNLKAVEGARCFAGKDGLDDFLAETDVLIALLPFTPETKGIINRDLLGKLSLSGRHERLPGPVLINAGRGGSQVEADILAALDAGTLYAASLDVFETEPLPSDSALWAHPRVMITPHNAAESNPASIVRYFLHQIDRLEKGQPLENIVDRSVGY